jgi:hypothetical protein
MSPILRRTSLLAALCLSIATAAGCGSSDDDKSSDAPAAAATTATTASTDSATNLADVCPSTVVIQTDWSPESDHSESYAIAAPGGTYDKAKKRYTADLLAGGKPTGVKVEIRAGGPATGFQSPTQQM